MPAETMSRSRRVAAAVVAALAAVFWGFFWFGLIDLLVVVVQDEEFHQDYLLESGWGLLYLVLFAVPLVLLAFRPGRSVALAQLAVVTMAVLAGAAWAGALPQLWNGLGLALTVGLLAALGRWRGLRPRRPDVVLAALAAVALPAAIAYAEPLARNATVTEDITNGVSHWPMQASLALAVLGLAGLAAVTRGRLPAWTAAFTAVWLGVESIVYPDLHGSLGTVGGALAALWGVLVVVGVELARRREPAQPG
ncbi:hypothetical protein [Nocardioides pocheonensis]|uniref:Uncharacterized protein n=1 Tax=Nocardioides pocheonensis TaxID=661485 RepID=A0A3N0GPE5_9ACTN|nr:hypothetical protein [Nocardioides pocheonensis]RNM14289.1 hypothetical protein EFL26_15340 [Nocardioides pocheonensis]